MIPEPVTELLRRATRCNICFDGSSLERSSISVPQPRWIGQNYWDAKPRIVIVAKNPGAGNQRDGIADARFLQHIVEFRDGITDESPVFTHQRTDMENWSALNDFYMTGFGLKYDDIAFINIAWCALARNGDVNGSGILDTCFRTFTKQLMMLLQPDVFILGGGDVHKFKAQIRRLFPHAKIEEVLHFAHRPKDRPKRTEQIRRVRLAISEAKLTAFDLP